ncbi:MAG TPA: 2-dehydropantoate 2-reductase [Actinomycetota bacterium]|nr:2-dehydropantoate 2-reductase [Actinomycetota bacterium]
MARVLVVGAGGVGGAFGAAMAQAGHDVVFVARGANLQALRTGGLKVIGARGDFTLPKVQATDTAAEAGDRDLILLTVKSYDLEEAAETVRSCGGIVLTLQNGVDAAERVRGVLGDVALAGTTGIVADLEEPGLVRVVSTYSRIIFGEPEGVWSSRTEAVHEWLSAGGWIDSQPREDVRIALWEKMALICAMGGLTTLYDQPMGPILSDPHGRATFRTVVEEVEAVGRARGVPLPAGLVEDRLAYAGTVDPQATSSMSRDLRRGKRVEVDHLNGAIVRMGAELGVPVPVNTAVYAGIRLAASKA